jgi:hypothetical protein
VPGFPSALNLSPVKRLRAKSHQPRSCLGSDGPACLSYPAVSRRMMPRSDARVLSRVGAAALTCFPAAALGVALAALITRAAAGEAAYCLSCSGPERTYLCRVTGESAAQNEVFKLYCIVRTLRKGRHASCAATGSSENCHGVVRTFKYHGPSLPAALAQNPKVKRFIQKVEEDYRATREVSATAQGGALPPQEDAGAPRRSMLQRMERAAHSAGAALGGFAQASYRCLRSLFRKCSRGAQE